MMAGVLSERVKDVLLEWATEMSEEMQQSLLRHDHVDWGGAGNLYQAATVSPEWITDAEGDALHLRIELPYYAEYLNSGTKPSSKKPSSAFIDSLSAKTTGWMVRKGIYPPLQGSFKNKVGKTIKRNFKDQVSANKSFAWAIATKRLKYGSVGSNWFNEVWGDYPVPENSEPVKRLEQMLTKIIGNAQFIVTVIDPNEQEPNI